MALDNLSAHMRKLMAKGNRNAEFQRMMQVVLADHDVRTFLSTHRDELSSEAVERSAAHLYEYVVQKGKISRGEQTFAPGYEPALRVSNHLIDVEYRLTKQSVVESKLRAQQQLVTMISMPKNIRNLHLVDYEITEERNTALVAAFTFVQEVVEKKKSFVRGLYLTGDFGRGKTFLLGAIAGDLADGNIATTLLHVPTFAVQMKAAIKTGDVLKKIQMVQAAPVLMLDDIGAESLSPWFRDEVLGVILQHRMQEGLPTCFSSNKTQNELRDFLAGIEAGNEEGVKADRLMERVRYLASEYTIGGVNRRRTQVNV